MPVVLGVLRHRPVKHPVQADGLIFSNTTSHFSREEWLCAINLKPCRKHEGILGVEVTRTQSNYRDLYLCPAIPVRLGKERVRCASRRHSRSACYGQS